MPLKIYTTPLLMEWTAQIPVNGSAATMTVHFTGGCATAYGRSPARFSTSNPGTQAIIEASDYFRSGRIALYRTLPTPEDAQPQDVQQPTVADTPQPDNDSASEAQASTTVTTVEVPDVEAAREYLRNTFGCRAKDIASNVKFQEAATRYNILFVYPDTSKA